MPGTDTAGPRGTPRTAAARGRRTRSSPGSRPPPGAPSSPSPSCRGARQPSAGSPNQKYLQCRKNILLVVYTYEEIERRVDPQGTESRGYEEDLDGFAFQA